MSATESIWVEQCRLFHTYRMKLRDVSFAEPRLISCRRILRLIELLRHWSVLWTTFPTLLLQRSVELSVISSKCRFWKPFVSFVRSAVPAMRSAST